MYYIQECDKPKFWNKIFNVIELYEDKIILPINNVDENIKKEKIKILVNKIKKLLDKTGCKKVCVSKKLKSKKEFMEELKKTNIEVIKGKWLYSVLTYEILEYIVKKEKFKKEDIVISILINHLNSDYIFEHLQKIVQEYKSVNIVTNNIGKFEKISNILEKEGIIINISNNKKKSLIRSKIILNIDFNTEQINQYNIPEKAIIVSEKEDIKINKKRFNGICINDYEIKYLNVDEFDYDKYSLYEQKDIYESQIYQNQPFEYIKRKLVRDKVQIDYLKGNKTIY